MYLYVKLLKWFDLIITSRFEFIICFSVIMGCFLTRNPLTTFLRETDIYFMLPAESELTPYFKYAFYYSLFIQALKIIVLMLILYPLFQSKTGNHILFFTTCIILLFLKYLNMNVVFYIEKKGIFFSCSVYYKYSIAESFLLSHSVIFADGWNHKLSFDNQANIYIAKRYVVYPNQQRTKATVCILYLFELVY